MSNGFAPDPDDYFAPTKMSFGDHIEELRNHLWRAVYGFLIALFASFFFGHILLGWITEPVKSELEAFYNRRVDRILRERGPELQDKMAQPTPFREMLFYKPQIEAMVKGQPIPEKRPVPLSPAELDQDKNPPNLLDKWFRGVKASREKSEFRDSTVEQDRFPQEELPERTITLWVAQKNPLFVNADNSTFLREVLGMDAPTTLTAQEGLVVWFKVCFVSGLVLGSPWIFWQIWMFVAAGLYEHEKKLVHVYLPISLTLFLFGVIMCQVFVIPKALEALLWFNEWLGFKPDLRLNEWLSFAIYMPIVFGLSFQTPLVMMFVYRIGLADAEMFRNYRSYFWFGMMIFAAIITPSTDILSLMFLWVPMSLLFELGIWLIVMSPRPAVEEDSPADELIEV
jgi:sec-independent protein translocase protein TatC